MNIYKILSVTILDLICRIGITKHWNTGSIWENWEKYNKKIIFNGENFDFLYKKNKKFICHILPWHPTPYPPPPPTKAIKTSPPPSF
jgi:hypothetical protein